MTNSTWTKPVTGLWQSAAKWGGTVPDSPTADATIAVAGTYTVTLSATYDFTADSVTLNAAGATLLVNGTLDLAGTSGGTSDLLLLDAGLLDLRGTISNGTIEPVKGKIKFENNASLINVTLHSDIHIAAFDVLRADGLYLEPVSGETANTIAIATDGEFEDFTPQAFNNLIVNLGSPGGGGEAGAIFGETTGVTTFGPTLTINSYSPDIYHTNELSGNTILNQGVINLFGGELLLSGNSFINDGIINVTAGSQLIPSIGNYGGSGLIVGSGAGTSSVHLGVPNYSGGTLTDFDLEANAGNTLALYLDNNDNTDNGLIVTDDSVLILNGAGSGITEYDSVTSLYVPISVSLGTIGAGGTLEVLGGQNFSLSQTLLIDGGALELGGGTFTSTTLGLAGPGSELEGLGKVVGAIQNGGTIIASGGLLDFTRSVGNGAVHGSLVIGPSATLELGAKATEIVTFTGGTSTPSTLKLDSPAQFTGTLSALAAGDTLDISGNIVSAGSIAGGTLALTLAGGGTLDYKVISPAAGLLVTLASDGAGGSDVVFYTSTPGLAKMDFVAGASNVSPNPDAVHGALFTVQTVSPEQRAGGFHPDVLKPAGLNVALSIAQRNDHAPFNIARPDHFSPH